MAFDSGYLSTNYSDCIGNKYNDSNSDNGSSNGSDRNWNDYISVDRYNYYYFEY